MSCRDCPQSWNQLKQGCAQIYVWKKFCLKILNPEKNLFLRTKMKKKEKVQLGKTWKEKDLILQEKNHHLIKNKKIKNKMKE